MNIFKYIKKAIVFTLVVFGLSWALQSPSFAAGLEGNWKLTTLGDSPVPAEVQITANFDPSQHGINGLVVCNGYFAGYESTEDAITLRPVASTLRYCGDEREQQYIQAIQSSKSYKVSDQELTINTDYPRANVLKFVKVQ
ncbi:MAG: META domain-containing protein [Nostoc sp. SerVER01]|nr:META domain-containing protein [Nostoc sp. SerVER01]MDZ8083786.1 META domain-containing protein [Nostoc sp. DcaGUA01]